MEVYRFVALPAGPQYLRSKSDKQRDSGDLSSEEQEQLDDEEEEFDAIKEDYLHKEALRLLSLY
jgi:hypothetical protein